MGDGIWRQSLQVLWPVLVAVAKLQPTVSAAVLNTVYLMISSNPCGNTSMLVILLPPALLTAAFWCPAKKENTANFHSLLDKAVAGWRPASSG